MFWELHRNSLEQDMIQLSQLLGAFSPMQPPKTGTAWTRLPFAPPSPKARPGFWSSSMGGRKTGKVFSGL